MLRSSQCKNARNLASVDVNMQSKVTKTSQRVYTQAVNLTHAQTVCSRLSFLPPPFREPGYESNSEVLRQWEHSIVTDKELAMTVATKSNF